MNKNTGYMNQKEAGDYLGISSRMVIQLFKDGKLKGYKKGYRTFLFNQKDLDEWVKAENDGIFLPAGHIQNNK